MQIRKFTKQDLPDMIRIEKLDGNNVESYLRYLHKAMALELQEAPLLRRTLKE